MRGLLIALPCIWLMSVGAIQPPITPSINTKATPDTTSAESHSDIQYDKSERMTLPVVVNGHSNAEFLVDTGSERTVVSTELAALLGLPQGELVTVAGTVGSTIAPTAHIQSLNFTNISISNLLAPVLKREDLGAEGLIGIDSLQQKMVVFDFENNRMEVKEAKRRTARSIENDDEIVVTARKRLGRLIITKAYLDNIPVTVVVDSGAQYSIGNIALLTKLQKKRKSDMPMTRLHSVTGEMMFVPVAKAKQLDVGKMSLREVPLAFANSPAFHALDLAKKPALLLGMNSMRAFRRVEVDFANRSVRFFSPDGARFDTGERYASR